MKKFLLLALLAGIGSVCAVWVTQEWGRTQDRNAERDRKLEVARWMLGTYIPITNAARMHTNVHSRIQQCDTNGLLQDLMVEQLTTSILALCQAYSRADFDAFLQFRLPAPDDRTFQINPAQLAFQKNWLAGTGDVEASIRARRPPGVDRPVSLDSPLGVFEAWWYVTAPLVNSTEDTNEMFLCQNCWREFSPDRFKVWTERRQSDPKDMLKIAKRMGPVNAVMEIQSMFKLTPGLDELLEGGEPVLFAHCIVPVKLDRAIRARPLLVTFYWSEARTKFLPHRMAVVGGDSLSPTCSKMHRFMNLLFAVWNRFRHFWVGSLVVVSAILLLAAAIGKIITYGVVTNAQAAVVVHQATQVPQSLALMAVLAELGVAAALLAGFISIRIRCGALFVLNCCFLCYRILNWGSGPCGCYVNPALLNSGTTKALEIFAWGSLLYMLVGSALTLLAAQPPSRAETRPTSPWPTP